MSSQLSPSPNAPCRDSDGAAVIDPRNPARGEGHDLTRQLPADKGSVRELPASAAMAGVNMRLDRGGVREVRWHKTAEWSFIVSGHARITAVDEDGRTFQADVGMGDLWYFPPGIPHSIQGSGEDGVDFLLVFDDGASSEDSTFLQSDLFTHLPRDMLAKTFGWPAAALARFPEKELYMFQMTPPEPLKGDRMVAPGRCRTHSAIAWRRRNRSGPRAAPCRSPAGGILGLVRPEAVAPAVVFLASDDARMVGGASFKVTDGGSAHLP